MNILNLFKRRKEPDFDDFTKDTFQDSNMEMNHAQYNPPNTYQNFDPTPQSPGPAYGNYDKNYNQGTPQSSSDLTIIKKDLEVISAKLDSLKVMLETQSQRIYQVERTVYQGDKRW